MLGAGDSRLNSVACFHPRAQLERILPSIPAHSTVNTAGGLHGAVHQSGAQHPTPLAGVGAQPGNHSTPPSRTDLPLALPSLSNSRIQPLFTERHDHGTHAGPRTLHHTFILHAHHARGTARSNRGSFSFQFQWMQQTLFKRSSSRPQVQRVTCQTFLRQRGATPPCNHDRDWNGGFHTPTRLRCSVHHTTADNGSAMVACCKFRDSVQHS